jgi:hypothetical protein
MSRPRVRCVLHRLVRVKGLEPPLPYGKQILSLPRLPFRHTRADRSRAPTDFAFQPRPILP